jgi:hypothetical protein
MAEDNFKKFKKRYEEGKISTTQMPPVPGAPGRGAARAVAGAVMNAGRQKLMNRLEASRQAGAKARNTPKEGSKGRSGTLSERLEATRARPRTKKESEKFGPLVKRAENLPAKQSRAVVKREENLPAVVREGRREVQNYKPGSRSVATQGTRTFGDKGQPRIVGLSNKGKLALGGGAAVAAAAAYKSADKPKADDKPRNKVFGGARPGERAGAYPAAKRPESKAPVPKAKPAGGSSSGTSKPVKAAGDKSRAAKPEKKFSNFERMKQRQYEKEGYGGRAMTAERAKAQVMKERGQKLQVPSFGKSKTANKATPKQASNMKPIEYRSQKARDFAAKMQGRNRSGKADSKFKFKDLFK